jgi:hypothetical protein
MVPMSSLLTALATLSAVPAPMLKLAASAGRGVPSDETTATIVKRVTPQRKFRIELHAPNLQGAGNSGRIAIG